MQRLKKATARGSAHARNPFCPSRVVRLNGDGVLSPSALRVYGVSARSVTVCLFFLCDLCPCLSSRDFDETSTWGMRQSEGSILYQSDAAWIILDYPSQSVGSILFGLFLTPGLS